MAPVAQHEQALAKGNAIRYAMAARRRELGNGGGFRLAAECLDHPDETVARMRLGRLLTALHRVGDERARKIVARAGLTPGMLLRRIGPFVPTKSGTDHVLTERQRHQLAEALRATGRP